MKYRDVENLLIKRHGDFRIPVDVLLHPKGLCMDVPKSSILVSQKDNNKVYFLVKNKKDVGKQARISFHDGFWEKIEKDVYGVPYYRLYYGQNLIYDVYYQDSVGQWLSYSVRGVDLFDDRLDKKNESYCFYNPAVLMSSVRQQKNEYWQSLFEAVLSRFDNGFPCVICEEHFAKTLSHMGYLEEDVQNVFRFLGIQNHRLVYYCATQLLSSNYGYSKKYLQRTLCQYGFDESDVTGVFDKLSIDWTIEMEKRVHCLYRIGCEFGLYSMDMAMTLMCEEGFEEHDVYTVVPTLGLDWSKCATTCAYLFVSSDREGVSKRRLYNWLFRRGFTVEECDEAVAFCKMDWMQEAVKSAEYLAHKYIGLSKEECMMILTSDKIQVRKNLRVVPVFGYTDVEANYGVNHCNIRWKSTSFCKQFDNGHKKRRNVQEYMEDVRDFGREKAAVVSRDLGHVADWIISRKLRYN